MTSHRSDNSNRSENPPQSPSSSGVRNDLGERLARLEVKLDTELKHLATKEDIAKLKNWVLGGVCIVGGGVFTAIFMVLARLFFYG